MSVTDSVGINDKHTKELVLNVDEMLSIANHIAVCSLDTVFCNDPARPIATTSYKLRIHCSLTVVLCWPSRLVMHVSEWMMEIVTNRVLGTLHTNEILIISRTSEKRQPIVTIIALVFVSLDKVPAQNEMLCDIVYARTNETHGHIVPWHTTVFCLGQLIALPIVDSLKVHDAIVVKVLTGEDLILCASRMGIGELMLTCVPATETRVETTDECKIKVYDYEFLVMSPVKDKVDRQVVWVTHDFDVPMAGRAFWTQRLKSMFCVD